MSLDALCGVREDGEWDEGEPLPRVVPSHDVRDDEKKGMKERGKNNNEGWDGGQALIHTPK